MTAQSPQRCIAFDGPRCIAAGPLRAVALAVKAMIDTNQAARILIFDSTTGEPVEIDLRGSAEDIAARLGSGADLAERQDRRGPGRPRLGVVAREVTLLPRHWDWLRGQPGGASVALRKLVEAASRSSGKRDAEREAREAAYRFISAMAGNEAEFEEAARALFAGNHERFVACAASWPPDIRDHATALAFPAADATTGG